MTWNTQQIKGIQWSGTARHDDWVDYLQRYPDIMEGANKWLNDQSNTHWANYVRQRGNMFNDFQHNTKYGLPTGTSMWDYGYQHAQEYGYKTNRDNWKVLGGGDMPRNQMAIGDDIYDFAKWHWENQGQKGGRTLRNMADVWAQEAAEKAAADAMAQQDKLAAKTALQQQQAAEQSEAGRLASRRGNPSYGSSASGAAEFKGRGLKASENRRGKRGTGQFKRRLGTSSLAIAAATGTKQQGTGLNIAG